MKPTEYDHIIVESYCPKNTSGLHGPVHIRPIPNQEPYHFTLHVQCSKALSEDYPVGTKFRIKAKLTQRENGGEFIYSRYSWPYEVLK